MATKITEEDKLNINLAYLKFHTYAAVARELGFSPSTVKKYVIPGFVAPETIEKQIFEPNQIPTSIDLTQFISMERLGEICILSEEELEEVKELWKELVM